MDRLLCINCLGCKDGGRVQKGVAGTREKGIDTKDGRSLKQNSKTQSAQGRGYAAHWGSG